MHSTKSPIVFQDETIFKEGEGGESAFIIHFGRVLLFLGEDDSEIPIKIIGPGEVFSEMSLIDRGPRSVSARAVGRVELIEVTKTQLESDVASGKPIGRLLAQVLLEKMRTQHNFSKVKSYGTEPAIEALVEQKKAALERMELEVRIANGLDQGEFFPFYQPIYDLSSGHLVGCEALLRWKTRDKGIVPPAAFIEVMEGSSLILTAGRVVIEKSLKDLHDMIKKFSGVADFFVSINIAGQQFTDPRFLEHLDTSRDQYSIPTHQVKLEITERVMTECLQGLSMLHQCRGSGYQLAIDDFGTGFSSLQYLANMPLTDLKIDRSFVMSMLRDPKSLSIVKSLISMASNLGLSLTAEGIEVIEEFNILKDLNVQMGQGYLFSKPRPIEEFLELAPQL